MDSNLFRSVVWYVRFRFIQTAPKKSACIVGEVLENYPHGDSSVYDNGKNGNLSLRYPMVDGQGNWFYRDSPAA
jgi:DNA gyrase/topoisomerase IV subunit A